MIVLDTNVLSEFMRVKPDDRVLVWVDAQPAIYLAVSAVIAWLGFAWFQKTRKGFADVL